MIARLAIAALLAVLLVVLALLVSSDDGDAGLEASFYFEIVGDLPDVRLHLGERETGLPLLIAVHDADPGLVESGPEGEVVVTDLTPVDATVVFDAEALFRTLAPEGATLVSELTEAHGSVPVGNAIYYWVMRLVEGRTPEGETREYLLIGHALDDPEARFPPWLLASPSAVAIPIHRPEGGPPAAARGSRRTVVFEGPEDRPTRFGHLIEVRLSPDS